MEAAPQEVLWEGEGTCFRVSAYPLAVVPNMSWIKFLLLQ